MTPKIVRQLQQLRHELFDPPRQPAREDAVHDAVTAAAQCHVPEPSSVAFTPDLGRNRGISSNLHPSAFDELMPKTLLANLTGGDSIRITQATPSTQVKSQPDT